MKRMSTVIRLDNGVEGLVFLRTNLSEMKDFISKYRDNYREVVKYLPIKDVFQFGKTSSYIMDGDSIIYEPSTDTFYLTRNPNWIDDFDFR